jgi:hypothetical protein
MGGIKHMNRNLFATCILALAFAGVASAQSAASSAETGAHCTKAQVKELKRHAQAPAQYTVLASYCGAQKADYLRLAAEAKKEWVQRSKNDSGHFGKYPRPVDSSRNLYEYYLYKASKTETLQAKYSQLAVPNAPVNAE